MKAILRGKDRQKDQSYFLWQIPKNKLAKTLFPIGEFETKSEVRQYAETNQLITANKKDSQGLCFIGKTPLRELLIQTVGKKEGWIISQISEQEYKGAKSRPKTKESVFFQNTKNYSKFYRKLGKHPGAFLYTIGQRQNLGLSGGPWYVQEINVDKNWVIVTHLSHSQELSVNKILINQTNWQQDLDFQKQYMVQVRYQQSPILAQISPISSPDDLIDLKVNLENGPELLTSNGLDGQFLLSFQEPIKAVAIGQSAVIYDQDCLIGGGIINAICKPI